MSEHSTSEYRVEKTRAEAELTLITGAKVRGWFFLWGARQLHGGPERVSDLLNEPTRFFPFELEHGSAALFNRSHVVRVQLRHGVAEAKLEPGYEVATRRVVSMLFSTGDRLIGTVAIYCPAGRDRLSDYARNDQVFRYLETDEHTWIINSAHLVELKEIGE